MNKIWIVLLSVSLISCATSRKPFSPSECNEQGGHERGFVEGKDGRDPDTDYVSHCREDLRAATRKGYQSGYDKGRVEYKEMLARMEKMQREESGADLTPEPAQPSFFCKIQWRGHGFESSGFTIDEARTKVVDQCSQSMSRVICGTLPECTNESAHANPRAFYCSLEVFGRKHEAFGPTMTETRSNLAKSCEEKEDSDFFCKEHKMKCKRNK